MEKQFIELTVIAPEKDYKALIDYNQILCMVTVGKVTKIDFNCGKNCKVRETTKQILALAKNDSGSTQKRSKKNGDKVQG